MKTVHSSSNGFFCISGFVWPQNCKIGSVDFYFKLGKVVMGEDDIQGEVIVLHLTDFVFFFK